jgi:hypothetical protein
MRTGMGQTVTSTLEPATRFVLAVWALMRAAVLNVYRMRFEVIRLGRTLGTVSAREGIVRRQTARSMSTLATQPVRREPVPDHTPSTAPHVRRMLSGTN